MKLSASEYHTLVPLLKRARDEAEATLEDLADAGPSDAGIYELDGAITDLFEYLNDSGLADRAAFH